MRQNRKITIPREQFSNTLVLGLGVGSAAITRVLLAAVAENTKGSITSVDNFFDWAGREPDHIAALRREAPEWNLVIADETTFLRNSNSGVYDLIVSDGDHTRGYQNAPDAFRVARSGAVLIFHDTNHANFRLLARLPARCRQLGFTNTHFTAVSQAGEHTDRGLLVVWKDRPRPFTLDIATRLYTRWRSHISEEWRRRLQKRFSTKSA